MCNHSVRANKLVYEALYKCLFNRKEDNNTEDHKLAPNLPGIQYKLNQFSEETTEILLDEFIERGYFEQL